MSSRTPEDGQGLRAPVGAMVLAVVVTLLASTFGLAGTAVATTDPQLSVTGAQVRLGGSMEIVGTGFVPGTTVDLSLCGAPDSDGRFGCTPVSEDVTVPTDGRFTQIVAVREPAGDCPCVVKAAVVDHSPVTTSVDVIGVPVATKISSPQVVVDQARLVGTGGLRAAFTGTATPELLLTLRNAGVAKAQPTLYLSVGEPGAGAAGAAVDDPGVPVIQPGEIVQVRVPVKHTRLLGGDYAVEGDVVVGDLHSAVSASARVTPWGLYGLVAAAVVAVAVAVRRRLRGPAPAGTSHRAAPSRPAARTAPVVKARAGRTKGGRRAAADVPVGPPRLVEETTAAAHVHVPEAEPEVGPEVEPEPEADPVTAYLAATAPEMLQPRTTPQVAPKAALDPLTAPLDALTGQFPTAPPAPLHLPAPPTVVTVSAPITPGRGTPAVPAPAVPAPAVIAPAQAGAPSMADALRARAAQRDAQIVTGAMDAIREHTAVEPAHLPDQYGYVPGQRDRRAPKGGKRAAR